MPTTATQGGSESLEQQLQTLATCSTAELRQRWVSLFDVPASVHLSNFLLRLAIAQRLQERQLGALPPRLYRRLQQLAADSPAAAKGNPTLSPGARFIRQWGGRTHVVDVGPSGFVWGGHTYPSLSRVAQAITGTHWSGPRFFGLRDSKEFRRPAVVP